jgi:sulfur carrier protein
MELVINGEALHCTARTVDELLLEELEEGHTRRGIAVAVNGEVVPRTDWPQTIFSAGDRIEIVRALPGG